MNRGQHILTNHTFRNNDSVLIVVTLPRHISHNKVTTQCQLSVLCSITLSKDITLLHALTLITDRTKVYNHVLVSTTELRNTILLQSRLKAYKLLIICTIIENTDCSSINILNNTITFRCNHCTWILTNLLLKTCTNDRCIIMKQWNCLAHHVTSHQCTVTVIMLQEWNQTCRNRSNLLWRHVDKSNRIWIYNRVVSILTTLNKVTNKCTISIQWCITLSNNLIFLFLCSQEEYILIIHIHLSIFNTTIWCNDKAKIINLCIHTEWWNQTDVRTFRRLNRTKTTIVSIVNVTYLETCTLTWQTTRTKSRETTLMSYLCQWIGLVHKLTQWVSTKEWVDDTWDSLCINQIRWLEHFAVTNVHALTDSTIHTCKTDRELVSQLLTYGTNTTIWQVVNIINSSVWVNQANKILNNLNDIILCQYTYIHIRFQIQLLVDTVTTYLSQVITLVREEKVLEHLTCTCIISSISITQLTINIVYCLNLRVARILSKCIENDRILTCSILILM